MEIPVAEQIKMLTQGTGSWSQWLEENVCRLQMWPMDVAMVEVTADVNHVYPRDVNKSAHWPWAALGGFHGV